MGFNTLTGMGVIKVLVNKITYINVYARYKVGALCLKRAGCPFHKMPILLA